MIVVASGHAGVDRFVGQIESIDIQVASTWAEVLPLWQSAQRVLLGESLHDFGEALEWLRQNPPDRPVLLWVSLDAALPGWVERHSAVHIWRGEIDGEALRTWCGHPVSGLADLPAVWSVISLFPYPAAEPLVRTLLPLVSGRYGTNGLLVDNDWGLGSLSLALASSRIERMEVPSTLRPMQNGWGLLVPAAPPWLPGMVRPGLDQIRGWIRGGWDWQGWWLGGRIADERAAAILPHMATVLFWAAATTPEAAFRRTWEMVRLYQPQLECWMVSEDGLPAWAKDERRLGRVVSLASPASEETVSGASRSRWWAPFRHRKGVER